MRRGYIQVYTGTGKGKTTAALGLALRAAGAGLRVFVAQFVKKRRCSEHRIIEERLGDLITVKQFGAGMIRGEGPTDRDRKAAEKGLEKLRDIVESGGYDVVILDEANVAVHYGLVGIQDLLDLMDRKPPQMELVITGRYARDEVLARADLGTEMREIKHYWTKGIKARRGIEW